MYSFFFLGRFPAKNEVGGVISFTNSFSKKYKEKNRLFIDFYPTAKKIVPKGVNSTVFKGNIFLRVLRLYTVCRSKNSSFFFNFSTVNSLIILAFLPKKKSNKWLVMLHNGEQEERYKQKSRISQIIFQHAFKKIDSWAVISKKQLEFYNKVNSNHNAIYYRVSPYIKPSLNFEKIKRKSTKTTFLLSGYPTKIYRHQETLTVLEKLNNSGFNFNVVLCLYGADSDNHREDLIKIASTLSFVKLYENLSATVFEEKIKMASCYLRMNSVDSFGLALAEAINFGIDVLATNVCERYPGARLINVDDFESLENYLHFYLKNKCFPSDIMIATKENNIVSFQQVISYLEQ